MAEKIKQTYTKKEVAGYLTGMFGQNMIYNIIATGLISYYFQSVLFLPALAISVIVAVARVWDAINDPMMGTIVDKTHTKWGKCRPYLIFFPAIIGVVTILCFLNGNYNTASSTGKVLIVGWAAVSYIIWGMVFTICDIPLWGITSLMTENENDRSKLLGLARIAAGVGGIGIVIVPVAQAIGGMIGDEKKGFILTVAVLTILSTLCFEFAGISTREKVAGDESDKRSIIDNFKIMWNCRPFRQILISGILRSPIQLLMLIAMPFVTYYYGNDDLIGAIITEDGINLGMAIGVVMIALGIFVGQFVSMAVTPALARKIENKTLYNIYSLGGAVPYALLYVVYLLAKGDVTPVGWSVMLGVCFFFASFAMGGVNVMQSMMIADAVDYEEYHKGYRPDGVFFSGQSFITKLSGGIAALIMGIVYKAVGFEGQAVEDMKVALHAGTATFAGDYAQYASAMFFLISIPVAVGMALSAIPTWKYAMTDKEHEEMLDELVSRRNADEVVEDDTTTTTAAEVLAENMDAIVDEINKL